MIVMQTTLRRPRKDDICRMISRHVPTDTRSLAIDTGLSDASSTREGEEDRTIIRSSYAPFASDRGTIVRIKLRSSVLAYSTICLSLHRISISSRINRSNLSLNKVFSRASPTIRLYDNFNRTLADAVESAATICARMMYRETRRRCEDVTGLFD